MNLNRYTLLSSLALSLLLQGCADSSGGGASSDLTEKICAASLVETPSFFEEVDSATSKPPVAQKGALRYRNVHVDVQSLKQVLKSGQGLVRLDLFNDKILQVKVESVEVAADDNLVMSGELQDDPLSQVTIAIHNNVVIANIHPGVGPRYTLQYQGEDVHTIQEVDAMGFDGDENCEAIPSPIVDEDQALVDEGQAGTPVIDMLVAYTPGARSSAGGADAMKASIAMAISDTNRSFSNSGVNLLVRLVGTMEVSQNDTNNFSKDLSSLRGKTDGRWDSVHAQRKALGADQVTLVGVYPNNGTAGIGYIKATSATAFSVVKLSAFGAYTFTHELGHNVGLNHSDGYVNSSGGFRTVMAYGSYPRVARFSNPEKPYKSYRTGDSNQNSASILNLYGGTTSRLYASVVPASQVEIPVLPPPTDGNGVCE